VPENDCFILVRESGKLAIQVNRRFPNIQRQNNEVNFAFCDLLAFIIRTSIFVNLRFAQAAPGILGRAGPYRDIGQFAYAVAEFPATAPAATAHLPRATTPCNGPVGSVHARK
jgi:hypothetical protein